MSSRSKMSLETTDQKAPGPANVDGILSALATEARRDTVRYFLESTERTATVDEIAGYVAERLNDPSEESRQRVRLHLHHLHLPKLANANLVDYDTQASTVRYCAHPFAERIVEWSG